MNNRELKLFHYENKVHITKKELEGPEIFVDGAVNAPMDLRIYGASYQIVRTDVYYEGANTKPSDASLFSFITDDETMTASVAAASKKISGDIVIPYEYEVDGKVYTVTKIAEHGFSDCYNLTGIKIPNGITTIGNYAFQMCFILTNIKIPNSVTRIGIQAFRNCYTFTNINIPSSVTSIERTVFFYCRNLTKVKIPNCVTSIGDGAFSDCEKLSDVYYEGTKGQWDKIAIGERNDYLLNATIHYISEPPSENHPPKIYSSREILLESSDGTTTNSTKIPLVGNAMEVSDFAKSNLTVDGKYYIADYIEYNSLTDKAYRYKFIDDTLFDNTLPLKDQIQVILEKPIVEELTSETDKYIFKNVKSIQDGCVISVNSYGADGFPSPLPLKMVANIKVIRFMVGTYKVKNLVAGITLQFMPFLLNGIKFDEYAMTISGKEYARAKVGEPLKIAAELLNANNTRIVFYSLGKRVLCLVPRPSILSHGVLLEE